jgi:hypothetical protein
VKSLIKKTKKLSKLLKSAPGLEGYIEEITHYKVEGWVCHKQARSIELVLTVQGVAYPLTPEWFYREDVAEKFGADFGLAGFSITLPASIQNLLMQKQILKSDFIVSALKTPLKIVTELPLPITQTNALQSDIKSLIAQGTDLSTKGSATDSALDSLKKLSSATAKNAIFDAKKNLIGYVEKIENFVIYGGLISTKLFEPDFKILLGKEVQDWKVVFEDATDIQLPDSDLASTLKTFQIELPGYVWDNQVFDKPLEVSLSFAEHKLGNIKVILEPVMLKKFCTDISRAQEDDNKQYLSLLAIEHIRFAKLLKELDPKVRAYYQSFAEQMQLTDFLIPVNSDGANDQEYGLTEVESFAVDLHTQMLWKAQKALNQLLIKEPKAVYQKVVSVIKSQGLVGKAKQAFITSVIPLLAKHNELLKLKQITDFKAFYGLDHGSNAWEVSLALAPLVADQQIPRATDALYRLAKAPNNGWLNTECVYFAITHIQQLQKIDELEQVEAENFCYALMALLDGFEAEWFSRLHDLMLIKSMVAMLQNLYLMTDYQRTDVITSAIKHYGLVPEFWALIESEQITIKDTFFNQAKNHWQLVYSSFNQKESLATNSKALTKAFTYFYKADNKETLIFLREWLNTLANQEGASNQAWLDLVQPLLADNSMEAIRFAANPLLGDSLAQSLIQENTTQIFDNLRLSTERASSVSYQAQVAASSVLKALKALNSRENIPLSVELKAQQNNLNNQFNQLLVPLNNWNAMFLSTDLLATKLVSDNSQLEANLVQLDTYLQRVILESKPGFFIPATACSALATLSRLKANPIVNNWLKGIDELLQNKFGTLHDGLFKKQSKDMLTGLGWPQDTLVVIYSCQAYLNTRIKAIRETWIKDLKARNIPYVIMVGDGDDTIKGDVLALNVSDTYEDLPLKSLKLFDWVYNNTNAQYVLKIDDDCYLDVDRYFDNLSYRKQHYYGRVIHRSIGGMDRTWHHSKSKTERAQKAIDKSPEPALYADGGGAYTLSRIAMNELSQNAQTIQGKRLIANSFMEDKLVGDLLAMSHIQPSNEDYECYQRRRTFGAATPVGMWENIFFPSKITPTVVTHLDTDKDQNRVKANKQTSELWPKRIWSSCWDVNIQLNSNQLELVSDRAKTQALNNTGLVVVAVMRNEMIMLKHFLKHYRELGVKTFIIADNCSDDSTRESLLEQPDVILYSSDTEYKHSHYGVAWQQAILASHCVGKWTLIADADELLVYPNMQTQNLLEFVQSAEKNGADCIRTDMIDMYPFGDLNEADFTKNDPFKVAGWHDKEPLKEWALGSGWFSNSKNWASSLRHRIDLQAEPNAFVSQKYALIKYKPWMRFSQGIHYASGVNVAEQAVQFAHFKYHAGFKSKIEEEINRKQHYDGAKEYKRYASMLAETKGGFGVSSVSIKLGQL